MDIFKIKCWNCGKSTIMVGPFVERKNSYVKFLCLECMSHAYLFSKHQSAEFKIKIPHVETLFIFKLFGIKNDN